MIAGIHIPVPPCVHVGAVGCGDVVSVELSAAPVAHHSGVKPVTTTEPEVAVATHLAVYGEAHSTLAGNGNIVVYSVLAVSGREVGHPVHMYTV